MKKRGQIFDFENDPEARRLRDKAMEEINAKYAERNRQAAEEKRQAIEAREKIREEKNRLAEENERARNEAREEARVRSENAIANLILSRKRRR